MLPLPRPTGDMKKAMEWLGLPAAVALNSLGFNLARTLGPAVGGALVAVAGPQAALPADRQTQP